MHRSEYTRYFWHAFDPIASTLSTFRGARLNFPSDPITAGAHPAFQRYRTGRAMVAAPNLIQDRRGRGLTAKTTVLSEYEHGQNAARRGKHLQACPFDTDTKEWRQWRDGFVSVTRTSEPGDAVKVLRSGVL
jgi:hypothetical protein